MHCWLIAPGIFAREMASKLFSHSNREEENEEWKIVLRHKFCVSVRETFSEIFLPRIRFIHS